MTGRHINEAGLKLLVASEGCRLTSYSCPAGVATVGYGHTGPDVKLGMTITQEQAIALLMKDLERFEKAVDELVTIKISDNSYSALVSLAFNIGIEAFRKSTLLRLLNSGDTVGAGKQLTLWVRAGGKIQPGLVTRRRNEAALFLRPDRG